jgi:hypothetical protein
MLKTAELSLLAVQDVEDVTIQESCTSIVRIHSQVSSVFSELDHFVHERLSKPPKPSSSMKPRIDKIGWLRYQNQLKQLQARLREQRTLLHAAISALTSLQVVRLSM